MKSIGTLSILPNIPDSIKRLEELSYNLWWSWELDAQLLYEKLDAGLWHDVHHNPVKFLHSINQEKLNAAANNADYCDHYAHVLTQFDRYMSPDTLTWFRKHHPDKTEQIVAYFSAEFGLHEALPIYSGGLGILSGDHCKAASDLGLPFVGVGFLYPQGYFTQHIASNGRQQAEYEKIDFAEVPAMPAIGPDGRPVLINVDLPGRTVYAKIWQIQVGRISIYLMDTDVERNAPQDRELSARLYGGDREMRISQEFVLGIGGVRALRALGIDASAWHMNEGHSAFLGLERVRELVQTEHLSFDEAVIAVRANTLFTTHTPVPAGNDAFAFELVEKFFWQYWGQLGIDRDRFIDFARQELPWGPQYSMTVLALRLSGYHNGVSQLHGRVSRNMWHFLWPDVLECEVPIGAITNGVHVKTWLTPDLRSLYDQAFQDDWLDRLDERPKAALSGIPNFSILDGWWAEGYSGETSDINGWSIGEEREYKDEDTQDEADVLNLYRTLENEILPLYYNREDRQNDGLPSSWIRIMKNAIQTCAPQYSMRRMLLDYTNRYYLLCMQNGVDYRKNEYMITRKIHSWQRNTIEKWQGVHIEAIEFAHKQITVGTPIELNAKVWLNGLAKNDVVVELAALPLDSVEQNSLPLIEQMNFLDVDEGALLYHGTLKPADSGQYTIGMRVRPVHERFIHGYEAGLIQWA